MIEFPKKPGEVRHFVHKRIGRGISGFFGGGPVGAIGGFLGPGRQSRPSRPLPRPRPSQIGRGVPTRPRPRPNVPRRGLIETFLPPLSTRGRSGSLGPAAAAGGCPQGFHPNKSDYMTKAGFVAQGSKCVRNRRRNLSNGRANTRSLRRMAAWDKQERKLGKTLKAIARGR